MPGSTTFFPATNNDEVANSSQHNMMGTRQPPPVAPRTTSITLQPWQQAHPGGDNNYTDEHYARSASTDSLESSGSSSSGGGNTNNRTADMGSVEYIPTRTIGKTPKLPSHNPLQFVKVQSPLYKKAEQQIKLTKEVKITREALKEGEEEWQSNLDNWKSRRRKVSEKVIQRAEEMRQIEAEEQLRQEQLLQQQKKIKKFSEIVEKKSARSYNLDLYIGQGDDSGLGGTPEPDDTLDCQSSLLRSDTSEGMTSEAESVDSDIHKSDKIIDKEPPKVPQKPYSRFKKCASISYDDDNQTNSNELFQHCLSRKDLTVSDNISSTEPSDVEGHAADTEATSSEEDTTFSGQIGNTDSGLESLSDNRRGELADSASDLSQDSSIGLEKSQEKLPLDLTSDELEEDRKTNGERVTNVQGDEGSNYSLRICIKHGDNKGFGFTLKGGKDQGCSAYVENVVKGGPADEMGLKDGDKIISLNGELSADYSHASLVFSIKQAVYTGILDVVISRTENSGNLNPEIKPRESRKGKSFAEKLAIFSAGINSPANIEDAKSNSKLVESKRESLVLRRRSAFENGKTENVNAINRRSSCVSHTVSTGAEKVLEKRHSVDFALSQSIAHENNFIKKGPPPPVPVKPKIKSKPAYFEVNKSVSKTNEINENNLFIYDSIVNSAESHSSKSQSENENLDVLENNFFQAHQSLKSENQHEPTETNKIAVDDNFVSDKPSSQSEINEIGDTVSSNEDPIFLTKDSHTPDDSTNFDEVGDYITGKFTSFEANEQVEDTQEFKNGDETLFEVTDETSYSFFKDETLANDPQERIFEESYEQESEAGTSEEVCTDSKTLDETSLDVDVQSTAECAIEFSNDGNTDNYSESDIVKENEINSVSSACPPICDTEDDSFASHITECKDVPETEESEAAEGKNNSQANASPLCLSLEKIDEDDVISASTTTSSDTPDTETVIETLPSNVSPLPNDESNGEDSSKILNCQDEESDQPLETSTANEMSSNEINGEREIVRNCSSNDPDTSTQIETSEDILAQPYSNSVSEYVNDMGDKTYDDDQQDDEYAQELEESLDQITSLDIIDRIEQSLMDQLQNEDPFEDIGTNLNSQLESDIGNPWLYYTEESELLDDLTPRNLEPPREPPPPPPPPEEIEQNDDKVISICRTNSTKRIKKELWRRRSDFLGIESPEAIDVDNIPPPPPGLEELLKQEREQTQWLEKRLSLAEPEIDMSSYSTESACLDSGNYSNNDYSDYFVEDNIEPPKETIIDSEHEQWKENLDEESLYETAFGVQYESVPETLGTVIEETVKITESPQHKAKQNIQSLGAAPKAKIMDSTKWITEKVTTVNKKTVEPVFRQTSYNQNYWLTQDGERRRNMQYSDSHVDRRYSMPPVYSNTYPDVTVRTWGDREYEFQQHRPRSAVYDRSGGANVYDQYMNLEKKDLQRTQSLDSQRDMNYDTDTLESEVHKCSCCGKGLCEGSAMGIEALRLYFHIECFRCCLCHMQLGNGSCGTDVQVKNNQLYCPSCFTVD